jgi:hypothetical protein
LSLTACSATRAGTPSAAAPSSAAAVPQGSYVALGDSYTAGPGIPDQAGVTDTYTPSSGHNACSAEASRWTEPLLPASPAAPLHPNAAGEQGMADAVTQAIAGTG